LWMIPTVKECDQYHFFWLSKSNFFFIWDSLASAISYFIFLFADHTGNTRAHHPLQLSQARNNHHP
jgi:hypothetical protein